MTRAHSILLPAALALSALARLPEMRISPLADSQCDPDNGGLMLPEGFCAFRDRDGDGSRFLLQHPLDLREVCVDLDWTIGAGRCRVGLLVVLQQEIRVLQDVSGQYPNYPV